MYKLQNMGNTNSLTGWSWQADLTAAQMEKVVSEEGVTFSVKLVGSDAQLWVDGSKLKTVDLPNKSSCLLCHWQRKSIYSHSMAGFWLCRYVVVAGILAFKM